MGCGPAACVLWRLRNCCNKFGDGMRIVTVMQCPSLKGTLGFRRELRRAAHNITHFFLSLVFSSL